MEHAVDLGRDLPCAECHPTDAREDGNEQRVVPEEKQAFSAAKFLMCTNFGQKQTVALQAAAHSSTPTIQGRPL